MRSLLSTTSLARSSARHPWRTIGIWLLVLGTAMALMVTLLSDALSTEVTTLTNNPESAQAQALLHDRLGDTPESEFVIVQSGAGVTVDDPQFRGMVETLQADLTALGPDVVTGVTSYYQSGDESLVSADRTTTLLPVAIPDISDYDVLPIHDLVKATTEKSGFQVLVTGQATLDAEIKEVAEKDLAKGESIGLPLALIILAIVFGALVAAFLPIILAIFAVLLALGGVALLGQTMDLPFAVMNIMIMLGLAVGIDYSLFIVSRFREERARGVDKIEAIARTGGSAGRTVVISGMTVAVALAGLLIMPDSSNQAIGAGAFLVVLAAVMTSLTLLPAVLSLLGDKINAPRIPFLTRSSRTATESTGGFWTWTTALVLRRPVVSLVIAVGLLLAASWSIVDMRQGEIGIEGIPASTMSREAYVILQDEFGFGQDLPALVVIDGPTDLPAITSSLTALETSLAADPAFASFEREIHPESDLTVLRVRMAGDALSGDAMDAIRDLRADYIPAAFAGTDIDVLVGGKTAFQVDQAEVAATYTPIVFIFVLACSFILLMVAFRSIVVPIKAILMNLLSVGAAYGLLVLVFQKGVGANFFGFQQVDVIQSGLPLFLFAVLFGLSMDYHVFLLSRIRERYLQTGDNDEAVEYGLRTTSRLITGAALIMVAVFSGFAMGEMVPLQQMGFGLAVAILVDATIIRTVLVPASMRLLGKWNWYMPSFLNWLPELHLEGETRTASPSATAAD